MNCDQQRQVDFDEDCVMMNGAFAGQQLVSVAVDGEGDFEPQPRDRCNTWPLQKSGGELDHTSPLIHEEIPEEGSLSGSNDNFDSSLPPPQHPPAPHHLSPDQQQQRHLSPSSLSPNANGPNLASATANNSSGGQKKNSARRNAWGNLSYADLITQAIMSSPEKRLTLSQIYEWMVQNVPYFRDKGDSNSSAGWKNSIRHNLSLHSRFVRIQNEGAGKSSWWVINPDAKPGKSSRRRTSTMPSGQDAVKASLEKKRRGVKKKIEQQRAALAAAIGQRLDGDAMGVADGTNSASSLLNELVDGSEFPIPGAARYHTLSPVDFRHRSDSNLSNYSSVASRLSPAYEDLELFDWESMASTPVAATNNSVPHRDLYAMGGDSSNDLATSMNLSMNLAAEPPPVNPMTSAALAHPSGGAWRKPQQPRSGVSVSSSPLIHHQASPVKASPCSASMSSTLPNGGYSPTSGVTIKSEPPSYQELYPSPAPGPSSSTSNCGNRANGGSHVQLHLRNALLIKKEAAATSGNHCAIAAPTYNIGISDRDFNYFTPDQQVYPHQQPQHHAYLHGLNAMASGVPYATAPQQLLPSELSDIQYDNIFKNDIQCDIDQVIRHELNIAGKVDFSIGDHFTNI